MQPRRDHRSRSATGPERTAWGEADEIERAAAVLARRRRWPELWSLACAAPVLDGVRAARLLDLRRWSPPDAAGTQLAARMAAVDVDTVGRVSATAVRQATSLHPVVITDAARVSFAARHAAVAHDGYRPPGESRIAVLDDRGEWADAYVGPEDHFAVGCLGPDDVLAVRDGAAQTELVRYTAGTTTVLARAALLGGARPVPVAHGFVVGLRFVPSALVCGFDVELHQVDLSPLGDIRTDIVAVDPTGTRVAFGGGRLVVLDWRLRSVIAEGRPPRGGVQSLTFAGPDVVITASDDGLCRWQLGAGDAERTEAPAPGLGSLFAIPAWRMIGGRVRGEARHAFHDVDTLRPVGLPRPLAERGIGPQYIQAMSASADGTRVLVAGYLSTGSTEYTTAVHDLRHPLSWITRPIAAAAPADLHPLAAAVDGIGEGSLTPRYPLSAEERDVLGLVHAVAAYRIEHHRLS